MIHKQIILLTFLTVGMAACLSKSKNNTLAADVAALNATLMDLHDTTMVRHGQSLSLIEQLKSKSKMASGPQLTYMDSIRTELDQSNESMMDWMANYSDPLEKDSAAINYLNQQIKIMNDISTHQIQNLDIAKKILNEIH